MPPNQPLAGATLAALLRSEPRPTWLLTARGDIVLANPGGLALLKRAPVETRAALSLVPRGHRGGFRVAEVRAPGLPLHFLTMARGEFAFAAPRLETTRRQWALTGREASVLALLVRGLTNDAMADDLACTRRAIEVHVTNLLHKSGCENRASLVARFWSAPLGDAQRLGLSRGGNP